VAVRHSLKVNEPVAEILNGIHDGWVGYLQVEKTGEISLRFSSFGKILKCFSAVPVEYVGGRPIPFLDHSKNGMKNVEISENSKENSKILIAKMPKEQNLLPPAEKWIDWLTQV
jgi:hypothetical protein